MSEKRQSISEEDEDMNFAFSTVNGAGTHYVTTAGQMPVTKLQQNSNGTLSQMVGMVGGVGMTEALQYVRCDAGSAMQAAPQLISLPIALPGTKPGDPMPTVQIQVLNPNMLQQQQPKYQIQSFQQGAVLTVAYSPDGSDGSGIQLLGNNVPEGVQIISAIPQEMQLVQATQDTKEQPQHQLFITPNQQIVINAAGEDMKLLNNNTTTDNNNPVTSIVIKEECEDDDESSQGTETSDSSSWQMSASSHQDLLKYLNQLPPQQTQALPESLQQFLKMNTPPKKEAKELIEVAISGSMDDKETSEDPTSEENASKNKKKRKTRKKPPKPARPKPGQVIIATASDGTPIFCCPECDNAYPEKEQLEMHLVVHKIERRFICGICGAGLKRKEHLERHKLGHNPERPYVCSICRKGFKRREHLSLHTVIHSGVKTEMCNVCGKGFYRKDHLRKHTRSHETRRARDPPPETKHTVMPEITIHVPTSSNTQMPIQINIPEHVVSSLAAQQMALTANNTHLTIGGSDAQMALTASDTQSQLDALLAHHS